MNANPYETPRLLAEYLLFHYGRPEEILPPNAPDGMRQALHFPQRTASWFSPGTVERALDLGCAVGRASFEMSRSSNEVIGIDFSRSFVDAARALTEGPLRFRRHDEGALHTELEATLPSEIETQKVRFEVGDAMNLRPDLRSFDRVHAANLLCRLPHPRRLLERLPDLVKPGGELVLATPCTWLEDYTPQENWPSGRTLDFLRDGLSLAFHLETTAEEPFLIRETARKFQWTTAQVSRWKRR